MGIEFLRYLQDFIDRRHDEMPEGSYTTSLFKKGINRMAQKVGEEAVETVIEATNGTIDGLVYEASDLIYHLIVLHIQRTAYRASCSRTTKSAIKNNRSTNAYGRIGISIL